MRVCVIFNPVAKGNKAARFRSQLSAIGAHAELKLTRCAGDARVLAAQAVAEGFECVVAAGGDGTLNEVLNGLGEVPEGFEKCALAVLPLGTVNVFARELKIPLKLAEAWQVVLKGNRKRVDLPRAEWEEGGRQQRRYFAQLGGAGLDARSIELVNWNLKKRVGPLAYIYAGLKALFEGKPRIQAENHAARMDGELVLIGNGRLYGGDFRTFEDAELTDGLLDVCVFPRANWQALLRCVGPLLLAGRLPAAGIRRFQAREFSLTSPGRAAFELDGELAGKLPVKFSIDPVRLQVVVP